jgi:putative NADH-flavin reductase
MAKVLVIGASRGIGLETVRAALRSGHSVRALARSAAPVQDADLDKVSGNALDRDTIRNALQDVDVVIQTLGVDFCARAIFAGTTLFSESTRILVDAMKTVDVKRLINRDRSRRRRQPRSWRTPLRCSRLSLTHETCL